MTPAQATIIKEIVDTYALCAEVHGRMLAVQHIDRGTAAEDRQQAKDAAYKALDLCTKTLPVYDPTLLDRVPADVLAAAQLLARWDAQRGDGQGWNIAGICNEKWAST